MPPQAYKSTDALYDAARRDEPSKRRGINSVETGIKLLEALVEMRQPATLKSIAGSAGMDTSQAHRYMSSLVNTGLVMQHAKSGLYDIGEKTLQIGLAALSCLDPITVISDAAKEVAHSYGHTCMVSTWSANGPIIVRWYSGFPPVHTTLDVGSTLPLTTSATGRVYLTYLESNYLRTVLEREGYSLAGHKGRKLRQLQSGVLQNGFATVDGSMIPGLRAYSAPIFAYHESLVATLTVVASESVKKAQDKKMIECLLKTCSELTQRLGGN